MDPEAIIGIAAACVAGLAGLGTLTFYLLYPRHFAAYFGCKIRSAPKTTAKGKRQKALAPKTDAVELQRNPILVLQDRKAAMNTVLPPLKIYRPPRKEFKVAPIKIPK